jgi:hypothetical protein
MSTLQDSRITESSGLAFSKHWLDTCYTMNDEAGRLFTVQPSTGKTIGTFTLSGVTLKDPEAIRLNQATGKLWVGDIGDNTASRSSVAIYVLPEPGPGNHTVTAAKFPIKYSDGPRNAEALLIDSSTSTGFIISKESKAHVYQVDAANKIARRITIIGAAYVSDATFTLSNRYALIRRKGKDDVQIWDRNWKLVKTLSVPHVTKGESITMDPDGAHFWIGSEGANSPLYRVPLERAYR